METKDELQRYIFGEIFLISNRLQTIGDEFLGEVTTKQWFFLVVIAEFFKEEAPSISEIAARMGTSRQNVKQIALKLEKKGFVIISKDEKDSRILRVTITEKSMVYWQNRYEKDDEFMQHIFRNMDEKELFQMFNSLDKFLNNISSLKSEK
ncbi:MAG: MarR family transcriptional regulator [Terrisporobacter sp.]|uniref:MarR family winged helix-turn-helix transcriptional regulator n=1 Tax=Terrisporobacter sp. TaxID=1965305 RepID=UPI002FCA6FD9